MQFIGDGQKQLLPGFRRTEQQCRIHILRKMFQQRTAYSGFAGTHFASEQYETTALYHTIEQMSQSLAVPLAHEEKARVRGNRERILRHTEIVAIDSAAHTHSVTVAV